MMQEVFFISNDMIPETMLPNATRSVQSLIGISEAQLEIMYQD
jgi:hypothetical protein